MSEPVKLSFSLSKPSAKPGTSSNVLGRGQVKSAKKPAAFSFGDDDDDDEQGPSVASGSNVKAGPSRSTASSSAGAAPPQNKSLIQQNLSLGRQARKIQEEALKLDQTVFEYDQVWDGMQSAREDVKNAQAQEAAERKPKYIESFLQSAATRKLDRLRAEEKMLQNERDKEGDEFAEKDKFVTGAYKKQMEEVKRAEQEEREREEKERASKKGPGMTAFYSNMLEANEQKHAAAVAASSANASTNPTTTTTTTTATPAGPSLAIRPPSNPTSVQVDAEEEEDPFIRRERLQRQQAEKERALLDAASASGPIVERLPAGLSTNDEKLEINDEGTVVDKRVLLKAGLNITKKPTSSTSGGDHQAETDAKLQQGGRYQSRAVGTDASYQARMARERQRLAEQMREERQRTIREKEDRERQEEERAKQRKLGSAGGDGEGEAKRRAAKERFEARKRAKTEQAAKDAESAN